MIILLIHNPKYLAINHKEMNHLNKLKWRKDKKVLNMNILLKI